MRGADKLQLLLNEDAVDFAIYCDEEQTFIYSFGAYSTSF
jgi:hypothetical protein